MREIHNYPHDFFLFMVLEAGVEWGVSLMTCSRFKNNFGLDLLRSEQRISGNTSNDGHRTHA